MKGEGNWALTAGALLLAACSLYGGADYKKAVEQPDATKILTNDKLAGPTKYKMPKGCVSSDPLAIARGGFIFNNLNGGKVKGNPPKGLAKTITKNGKTKPKQYGNCVACHNIEGAKGAGDIGPDLTKYHDIFVASGVRDYAFVYQKIADPRIDNPDTHMTVNLTTGLFNEREICDIVSFVVSKKK